MKNGTTMSKFVNKLYTSAHITFLLLLFCVFNNPPNSYIIRQRCNLPELYQVKDDIIYDTVTLFNSIYRGSLVSVIWRGTK